jgi:hypothetical protein
VQLCATNLISIINPLFDTVISIIRFVSRFYIRLWMKFLIPLISGQRRKIPTKLRLCVRN